MPIHRCFRKHTIGMAVAALAAAANSPVHAADYTWTTGDYASGITSPNPLAAADTLTIDAGGTKRFVGVSFTNAGTVNWLGDTLQGANSAVVTNQGLWDSKSDTNGFLWVAGGQPQFVNTGTLRKSAGSLTNFGTWAFVNDGGLINAQVGTLAFNGGYATFNDGTRFSGAGLVSVTGNATFNGSFRADNLSLAGGSVAGNSAKLAGGVANTGGAMSWSGGDLTGTWEVAAGSTLTGLDGGTKRMVGGQFVNNGSLLWQSTDSLQTGNSSSLTNNGLYEAQASHQIFWAYGGQGSFVNSATGKVTATGGSTLTFGNVGLVSNGGQFDVAAGNSILYNGGSATFNDGTRFTGAGVNSVGGNARFVGGISSSNLRLAGGAQTGGDGSAGSMATLSGTTTWVAGDLNGSWKIAAGATLNAVDTGTKRSVGASIVNDGTWAWISTDSFQHGNSSVFTNNGLFVATADATMFWAYGGQGQFINSSSGIVRADGGKTLTIGNVALASNGGEFNATAGAKILYNGGYATFNEGTRFTGAGTHAVTNSASYVGNVYTGSNVRLEGGSQTGGDGSAGSRGMVNGQLTWVAADVYGAWDIKAGSTLTAVDAGNKRIIGADVVNNGTVAWNSTDGFQHGNSSVFTNNGLFDGQANSTVFWGYGGQGQFINSASGVVRASNGATLNIGNVGLRSDGGEFNAAAGSALVYNGGSAVFNDGTRFTGAGTQTVSNNTNFAGTFQATSLLKLAGGTHTGGNTTAASAQLSGQLTWAASDLNGTWEVKAGSTLIGVDGGAKRVFGTLANNGTIAWNTAEALQFGNSASFTNNGRVELAADGSIIWCCGGQPSVVNNGTIVKTGGTGESSLGGPALTNNGVIDVRSGAIRLPDNFANGGTLTGTGSFNVGGTLTNNGRMAPGISAPGTLAVVGNYAQGAAGFFDVDVLGLGSHDLLTVTGNTLLGGTLALNCFGSCSMAVGDEIVILDGNGSLGGTFASVSYTGFASGQFDVVYDTAGARVLLRVTETVTAVPEPETWALMLGGLAMVGWLQRRRQQGKA